MCPRPISWSKLRDMCVKADAVFGIGVGGGTVVSASFDLGRKSDVRKRETHLSRP